jgi:magnesium-transporting ATPase (P-type)
MGKEGNQASAFADYAIPNFKSLRRLLFWHGAPFALKLTNFTLWMLFKGQIFGCSVWFYNFFSGMSGIHTVDDLLWSLNPVLLANFASGWYTFADHPVSLRDHGEDETVLNDKYFRMSHWYENTRKWVLRFKFRYLIAHLYCWLASILLALLYFESQRNGAIFREDGLTLGAYEYGVFMTTVCFTVHQF